MSPVLMGGLVGAVFGAGLLVVVRRLPFLRKPTADERISPYLRDLGGPEVFVGVVDAEPGSRRPRVARSLARRRHGPGRA